MNIATSTVIQTMDSNEQPKISARIINGNQQFNEFCSIEVGVHRSTASFYIKSNAATLREWATGFQVLADKLNRMADAKDGNLFTNALPATDPASYPELSMEVDG